MGDGPLLFRVAPQCESDGAAAEHLILRLAGEDVLKFDIVKQCLRFGDKIVDYLTTATAASDDDLLGCLIGLLRFGDDKWNLAFFLLRTSGSRSLQRRRLGRRGAFCIDQSRLIFRIGFGRRAPSADQRYQYEQGQPGRAYYRCLHAEDSTH